MNSAIPYQAVVADLDGVLTRTARLHRRAWKQTFDEFLQSREPASDETITPFTDRDYWDYVDGKPRYDGVRDFLTARNIGLPEGDPSDGVDQETICGLGNRKNERFLALLDSDGVSVFDDAVVALDRWRRGGLKLAAVSASRNCRRVLDAAHLMQRFDAIVDGESARQSHLTGKRDIIGEALNRLHVTAAHAVVLEDAPAGVQAAREAGAGFVVGVSRNEHQDQLYAAGADTVVERIDRAGFSRRLPSVLQRREELLRWRGDRKPALFLDFDGTLAPIVDDPKDARLPSGTRGVLSCLSARMPVAVISGRDRAEVQARVNLDDVVYAGNHGFDIAGGGRQKQLPDAEASLDQVDRAERRFRETLAELPGVIIERKRFSVAAHYRQVKRPDIIDEVANTVQAAARDTGLRRREGKKVFELEPDVDWNKGRALQWLMDVMNIEPRVYLSMYIGDDVTDEDAFAALGGLGPGILVGPAVADSLADYRLASPAEVREFLAWLAGS